jgi:lipoprotein-releasing system permease protein
MNGFEAELRDRLLVLSAHARVVAPGLTSPDGERALRARLLQLPGVIGVAPYMDLTALAVHVPDMVPVVLRGIDPTLEQRVTDFRSLLVEGRLQALSAGSNGVILGQDIADQLGVHSGDLVTLLVPMQAANGTPEPRLRQFNVVGVFSAGLEEADNSLILANLADVHDFAPLVQGASGLRLRFDDPLKALQYMPAVRAAVGPSYLVSDWTQDNANYFRAVRIEKTMMALILMLVVAVAAFNIVAMLVMVVNDKRTDIAILRTFGASPADIMQTFITQGVAIGWLGVAAGLALGLLLALHVSTIVPVLERVFHFQFLSSDVYYITSIPSEVHWSEVAWISAAALLLTLGATVYPALRGAATPPAEALRYE